MIGYVYKIISVHIDKIYVGSTVQSLEKRLSCHKSEYRGYKLGKSWSHTTSFDLIELGEVKIELIEEVEFTEKYQLLRREKYWIEQYRLVALNKATPINDDLEKFTCRCGSQYTKNHKSTHMKSAKHKTYEYMKYYYDLD